MDHAAKVRLGREIAKRVGRRFGPKVVFRTLAGSVARGEDTQHSDLEMRFVTREPIRLPGMSRDGYREFLYRGLQTQIEFRTEAEIEEILGNPGPGWEIQVWEYLEPVPIYGDPAVIRATVAKFRDLVASLPDADFRRAAGLALMWARGALGKIRNAVEAADDARAVEAAAGMGHSVASCVALANRRYTAHADLRSLEESRSFPDLPANYAALMRRLYLARSPGDILAAALALCAACETFARSRKIEVETVERLDDLGL